MKKQEIYTIDNNRIDKLINNMYIPVNQQNDYLYSTINNGSVASVKRILP